MTTADSSTTPSTTSNENWVGIADAANEVGVAAQTVRNWVAAGTLKTQVGQGPRGSRTEVDLEQVRRLSPGRGRPSTAASKRAAKRTTRGKAKAKKTARRPAATDPAPVRSARLQEASLAQARGAARPLGGAGAPAATPARAAQAEAAADSEVSRLLAEARQTLSTLQHRVDQLEASVTALQQARNSTARRKLFGR